VISAIFFISGVSKITAPAATIHYIASVGLPFSQLGLVIGIAVELVVALHPYWAIEPGWPPL
jgi:putative oxidoreductase